MTCHEHTFIIRHEWLWLSLDVLL